MVGLLVAAAFGLVALGLAGGAEAQEAEAQVTGGGWARACVGAHGGLRILLPPNTAGGAGIVPPPNTLFPITACGRGETPFALFGGPLVRVRFLDLGLTVLDTKTGLQWEKKNSADGGADPNNLHDVDNRYNWCDATGGGGGADCNPPLHSWIAQVNAEHFGPFVGFAGHNDWRVPTKAELESILLAPFPNCPRNPCIDPIFGPTGTSHDVCGSGACPYWSATQFNLDLAWGISFADGFENQDGKRNHQFVRAVRTGP
jgi:hypothetical protein